MRLWCVLSVMAIAILTGCSTPGAPVRPLFAVESYPSGASTRPIARPAVAKSPVAQPVSAAAAGIVGVDSDVPRLTCDALSRDDQLTMGLIQQRVKSGEFYAALAQIQSLPSNNAHVAIQRADVLRRLGRPEAAAWYNALRKGCEAGLAEHGLGLLAAEQGHMSEALTHLMIAARLVPSNAEIRNDLGYVRMALNQDDQAEFELRTAAELAPDDKRPLFNLVLLTLVHRDMTGWLRWLALQHPEAQSLADLADACDQMMQTRTGAKSAVCPIDPRRVAVAPVQAVPAQGVPAS